MISVIIPTYNRCQTLKSAVKSVLEQTYQDYEIIVVDDGSKDDTSNYMSSLNYENIRYIRFETNRGGCSARNEGIKESNSNYIAFLDDDDYWMATKLEKQIKVIKEEDVDLCYSAKYIVVSGKRARRYSLIKPRYKNRYKSIMHDNFIGSTSSVLVKKTVLENVGGFDPSLPALQDYDLYIRIISKGYRIKEINEPLLNYQFVDERKNITCSYNDFRKASEYLMKKYNSSKYLYLLKKAIRRITVKRVVKSRRFMLELIRYYLKGFKLTSF